MTDPTPLEVIRRWAFCVCSPERAPTAPCSCPGWASEAMVYDYAWRLEQDERRRDREVNSPRAKAERRRAKRK